MATAEFVEEMAAGQQIAVEPYMFKPESDPKPTRGSRWKSAIKNEHECF